MSFLLHLNKGSGVLSSVYKVSGITLSRGLVMLIAGTFINNSLLSSAELLGNFTLSTL